MERSRRIKLNIVFPVIIGLITIGLLFFSKGSDITPTQSTQDETFEGVIVSITNETKTQPTGEEYLFQIMDLRITTGSNTDEIIEVVNDSYATQGSVEYREGDRVLVARTIDFEGEEVFYIVDFIRFDSLLIFFGFFAVLAIVIGGRWGSASLIGMGFSFLVIFRFVLPQIMNGHNAILIAIIGSAIIIPVTFGLSHGLNVKTLMAGIGTVITLVITGLIATFAIDFLRLTGYGSEEGIYLRLQLGDIANMQGILLAGVIISSLGVLDDITISQASVVRELKQANKKYGFAQLYKRGMNVGRDHIASLVNTLVLVYAGASLPLMLLFFNSSMSFSEIVNIEMITEEIFRTLVGSIGLILAVPITTLLSAYFYTKDIKK